MIGARTVRDSDLIDALESIESDAYEGSIWRVVREGKDPCQCSSAGGRWDDGTFDVLYSSVERDGAIAEMHFHLSRGQPIMPSKVRYKIFELSVSLSRLLRIPTLEDLTRLGFNVATFGQLSHDERIQEYPRTQDIAETAHFLEFDGMLVPSARWNCANMVVFCDQILAGSLDIVEDHGVIDWAAWKREKSI